MFASLFDAQAWARKHLRDAPTLESQTLSMVAGFTLMWGLFEALFPEDRPACVAEFDPLARRLIFSPEFEAAIDRSLDFYRRRYLTDGAPNARFNELHFRPRDRREDVEAVLTSVLSSHGTRVIAVLIIVWRIRNNLFHGLKTVDTWNAQVQNISEASRVLSLVLEASGEYVIESLD
jgi:hypothetical protein